MNADIFALLTMYTLRKGSFCLCDMKVVYLQKERIFFYQIIIGDYEKHPVLS